jgi:hypothetical protein
LSSKYFWKGKLPSIEPDVVIITEVKQKEVELEQFHASPLKKLPKGQIQAQKGPRRG